jgi:predicted nucleic acid-binding protein
VAAPTALFDANILLSMTLTDLVVEGAYQGLFKARWSADIHAEWIRSLLNRNAAFDPAKLDRRRGFMDTRSDGSLVTGYQHLIPILTLPDPNDRHVLAAAITGACEWLVTFDLLDFPPPILAAYGVTPIHPDAFFMDCAATNEAAIIATVGACRGRML